MSEYKKILEICGLISNYSYKILSLNYSSIKLKYKLEKKFIKIS
jgi:hypothetical protein